MELKELRKQSASELNEQIVELRREQFNLRMQRGAGNQTHTHHFKRVRREIAQIKTLITQHASPTAAPVAAKKAPAKNTANKSRAAKKKTSKAKSGDVK
jgi:large subunit ribosomal protein L29